MSKPATTILSLRCEIRARSTLVPVLEGIARTCAHDVGQPLVVAANRVRKIATPEITLVLPVEAVVEPHRAWCLACRLACFCPQARVSVLIVGIQDEAGDPLRNPTEDAA